MDNIEFVQEHNDYIAVDVTRPSTPIPDEFNETIESDPYYRTFNKLMQSFFDNHHDDARKDTDALNEIMVATNNLIISRNTEAIDFRRYCDQFIQMINVIKTHPSLD